MRSQNGNSPVPPASTMILPGSVDSSYSPLPLGQLSFIVSISKFLLFKAEVILPLAYVLSIIGK